MSPPPPHLPDVGVLACPRSEGLQLALGLTHPCIEEIELAKCSCADPCITVDRVISRPQNSHVHKQDFIMESNRPLVMLYEADNIMLP